MRTDTTGSRGVLAVMPALSAASVAVGISSLFPLAGPLLIALAIGIVVANTRLAESPAVADHSKTTKTLLRLGVVLLGLKLPVKDIADIGPSGLAVVVATVLLTYLSTIAIGDRLGLDRGFVTLLAAGFSICGAAAIAAVDDAVRAKQRYVALAVAMVTAYGSLMIFIVPWMSRSLGLTDGQAAVWAGASIHEVAQVVAAASLLGTNALAVATTVKLGRVMLLAPMYTLASRRSERGVTTTRAPVVPWFVVGFGIAVIIRSVELMPPVALRATDVATTLLLAAGMFGLGLGIRGKELWPVPLGALLLAAVSTAIAGGVSLVLTVALVS